MTMKTVDNGVARNMTADEQAEHQAFVDNVQAQTAAQQQAAAETAAARNNALAKLKALGLTDAEVAALVGGSR